MKVVIFHSTSWNDLQKQINEWLSKNPVYPEGVKVTYGAVVDEEGWQIIHTVCIWYVPMHAM